MKIWSLEDPRDRQFAWFDVNIKWIDCPGTWGDPTTSWDSVAGRYGMCRECGASQPSESVLVNVEWEPGSNVIGDFSWDVSGGWPVVKATVFETLRSRFKGIASLPVKYYQNPKAKRPIRPDRRTKPRVWLPYEGPPQVQFIINKKVHLNRTASSVRRVKKCDVCGKERWKVEGVEEKEGHWDKERRLYFQVRHPRQPGKGIFVRESELEGSDFLQTYEIGWYMCTDLVKTFIEENGITNVDFYEVGEVI